MIYLIPIAFIVGFVCGLMVFMPKLMRVEKARVTGNTKCLTGTMTTRRIFTGPAPRRRG